LAYLPAVDYREPVFQHNFHASFPNGTRQDLFIRSARRIRDYGDHIVSGRSQLVDAWEREVLVSNEQHQAGTGTA